VGSVNRSIFKEGKIVFGVWPNKSVVCVKCWGYPVGISGGDLVTYRDVVEAFVNGQGRLKCKWCGNHLMP
jgi:hypothetical protein